MPHHATIPDGEIVLGDAPERFFDPIKWSEFVSNFADRSSALSSISQPDDCWIAYFRWKAAQLPTDGGAQARKDEATAALSHGLVEEFRAKLVSEKIVATALSPLAIERVKVPGERWSQLWPNFANNSAGGAGLNLTHIWLFEHSCDKPAAVFLKNCTDWMKLRGQAGETRRKVLQAEAIDRFSPPLTTSIFAAAYKAVFAKPRGRPRKNNSNK